MQMNGIDVAIVAAYFVVVVGFGMLKGRGQRTSAEGYFVSKGNLPWWAIGAAYVATGMNSEQLIGLNGMGYKIGLPMVNWSLIAIFVYSALMFVFFPVYLRNGIVTMPQYLGKRFDKRSENVFAVLLLVSYILLNLAVVFYGGAKLLEVVFGIPLWVGLVVLALASGVYTVYGGQSSMVYAAFVQFVLIFGSGLLLFVLGILRLPGGWHEVIARAPCGFHLIKGTDYPMIPWHAIVITIFGLHLFYSCINQALVQRGFGARTEWDVRMAMIFAGFFVLVRPFVEVFPGMMARALAVHNPVFDMTHQPIDNVFPLVVREWVPAGLQGMIIVGILSSVMSTISAFLASISTLFTYDVYKKWIRTAAEDRELVRVGTICTLALMVFSVAYCPLIGRMGGIFQYFQSMATYLAVPVATVFLFGVFWRRTTPTAALAVIVLGIPLGVVINQLIIPDAFPAEVIRHYSLDNFFVASGFNQLACVILMLVFSAFTPPKAEKEIAPLLWSKDMLHSPPDEPKRPFVASVAFWWTVLAIVYAAVYVIFW